VQKKRLQELKNFVRSEMKIVCPAKAHKFVTAKSKKNQNTGKGVLVV